MIIPVVIGSYLRALAGDRVFKTDSTVELQSSQQILGFDVGRAAKL